MSYRFRYEQEPLLLEKIIATLSYVTAGFVGFIWLILAVVTKNNLRSFLKYHVYQAIFLSIVFFLLSTFVNLLLGILSYIPMIKNIVAQFAFLLSMPIVAHFSVISLLIMILQVYLIIGVLQNKYSYIPWVSDVINYNVRR